MAYLNRSWIMTLCTLALASGLSAHAESSGASVAQKSPTLREHMRTMGYLLDEVFARTQTPRDYADGATKARELRRHLVSAISLEPTKLKDLNENERHNEMLEFHQAMARVIYLTATLEKTLVSTDPSELRSGNKDTEIKNILHELGVVVGKSHAKFRD